MYGTDLEEFDLVVYGNCNVIMMTKPKDGKDPFIYFQFGTDADEKPWNKGTYYKLIEYMDKYGVSYKTDRDFLGVFIVVENLKLMRPNDVWACNKLIYEIGEQEPGMIMSTKMYQR